MYFYVRNGHGLSDPPNGYKTTFLNKILEVKIYMNQQEDFIKKE
jgi:hypothetical protein